MVLDELACHGQLDWSRYSIDSVSVRAKGGPANGSEPHCVDQGRGKRGSKYHLLVDRAGTPLNIIVCGVNRHDSIFLEPMLDSMPAINVGGRGHPRRRPVTLHGDKGYDNRGCRAHRRRSGNTARVARIGIESRQRLGRHRWVVGRTVGWLLASKRLALRYDRTARRSMCWLPSGSR